MTDRRARVYENNEANWGSVLEVGEGIVLLTVFTLIMVLPSLLIESVRDVKHLINQLWLSHLPERITAYGFAVSGAVIAHCVRLLPGRPGVVLLPQPPPSMPA